MTTTNQKVNLNNCTHEQIFKAISKIQAKAASFFIKDEQRIGHHMKPMTAMAVHYVINSNNNFNTTRQGHPKFDNFLPSELGATKDYWEEKAYRLDACLLLHILVSILEARPKSIRR